VTADVFATAAFAMGREGIAFVEAQDRYEALAITPDLEGILTSGFAALCA
jgi:thiamine biosynthesis lipoprotein